MRSLQDALALARPARSGDGEDRPSKAKAFSRGLVTLSLLATFGAVAGVGLTGLGWREFSPPGGGFRVVVPGKPIEEDEGETRPQGRATGKKFVCRGPERGYVLARLHVYGVAFLDYPAGYVARNSPAQIFREQRDALAPSEGKLVSEKSLSSGGFPGTELRIETSEGRIITCRLFLVRQRLYMVMAKYPKHGHSRDVDAFFDSFALTEP